MNFISILLSALLPLLVQLLEKLLSKKAASQHLTDHEIHLLERLLPVMMKIQHTAIAMGCPAPIAEEPES